MSFTKSHNDKVLLYFTSLFAFSLSRGTTYDRYMLILLHAEHRCVSLHACVSESDIESKYYRKNNKYFMRMQEKVVYKYLLIPFFRSFIYYYHYYYVLLLPLLNLSCTSMMTFITFSPTHSHSLSRNFLNVYR